MMIIMDYDGEIVIVVVTLSVSNAASYAILGIPRTI